MAVGEDSVWALRTVTRNLYRLCFKNNYWQPVLNFKFK